MNFLGSGGLALAVVAALWILVFVPSWFSRAEEREHRVSKRAKSATPKLKRSSIRVSSQQNFDQIVAGFAAAVEAKAEIEDRTWQRTELPAPIVRLGELEVAELAEVVQIEPARQSAEIRKLDQKELDEILRRRRANG
jgi:hypothetical protein